MLKDRSIHSEDPNRIQGVRFTTPLGSLLACATRQGLCVLEFADQSPSDTFPKALCQRLHAIVVSGRNPHLDQTQSELAQYFLGERKKFTVSLHLRWGTPFQRSVWAALQTIPYGETWTYKQQAIAIGNPKAVRAVASANSQNPIAILTPCHRVIGSDGNLMGYRGGLQRKQALLDLESSGMC